MILSTIYCSVMWGIVVVLKIYQVFSQSLSDEFRIVHHGNCASEGGNRFCRHKVLHSFCDNLENICICLAGYVAVQESMGKLCKPGKLGNFWYFFQTLSQCFSIEPVLVPNWFTLFKYRTKKHLPPRSRIMYMSCRNPLRHSDQRMW